jgi:hypothetical protein
MSLFSIKRFLDSGLVLLLALLPFELVRGLSLPGLVLTNIELLAMAVLAGWAVLLGRERRLPRLPRWFGWALAGWVAALLLSALLAESQRGLALKFALRHTQGALLAACLADRLSAGGGALARRLLGGLAAGALVSAALGVWEISGGGLASAILDPFRKTITLMGGILRLSASFQHANIAGMYLESTLPLLIAGGLGLLPRRWRWAGLAGGGLLWAAVVLTYSRGSIFTAILVMLATVAAAAARWGRGAPTWRTAGLAGLLLSGLGLGLLVNPALRLRLSAIELESWYNASYRPAAISALAPGELRRVPVGLTNTGKAPWQIDGERPIRLAYHWLNATSGIVFDFEGLRTDLPRAVAPGESIELLATVRAPSRTGEYLLAWDMVGEDISWFSQLGVKAAQLPVIVSGAPASVAAPAPSRPPSQSGRLEVSQAPPSRRALWGAAVTLWRQHPLLGIGPAVFQYTYGPVLGLEHADPRYHTHSMYLEALTGSGVVGLLALLALVGQVAWHGLRGLLARAGRLDPPGWWALLACLAGLLAFLIHGAVDMFLAFTPTYLLLWTWIGMIVGLVSPRSPLSPNSDHNVHSST